MVTNNLARKSVGESFLTWTLPICEDVTKKT